MKALISTIEPIQSGFRVAQVEPDDKTFVVAEELFWVDCPDDLDPVTVWYDPADSTFKPIPKEVPTLQNQPVVQGAQTI